MFSYDDPTYLPPAGRIVVIGDVHGDLSRLTQSLIGMGIINSKWEWTAEPRDTIVVQMGDQVDSAPRVPDPFASAWEQVSDVDVVIFMDKLDTIARCHGGRALSLIGNHELMNIVGDYSYVSEKSMTRAGGPSGRRLHFHPTGTVGQILAKRNVVMRIGPLLFVHGGLLPHHLAMVGDNLHRINEAYRRFAREETLSPEDQWVVTGALLDTDGLVWTRDYMTEEGLSKVPEVLERTGSMAIFTGHNTVQKISSELGGRVWFTDAMFSRAYGREGEIQLLNLVRNASGHYVIQTVSMVDAASAPVKMAA